MDGPKGGEWAVAKVGGPSEVDSSSESGRSFDEKWTVLQKVDGLH